MFSNASQNDAESKRSFHLCRMNPCEESWQRRNDALVPLTQKCGQNVFADSLTPQMIAAVAARMSGRVEVDPVILSASGDTVASGADPLTSEPKAPLQPIEIDAASGIEVDENFVRHVLLPIQAIL
jgi:hypothetical protein